MTESRAPVFCSHPPRYHPCDDTLKLFVYSWKVSHLHGEFAWYYYGAVTRGQPKL